jgi:hypothetical protein
MIFLYGEKLPAHPFLDAKFAVQGRIEKKGSLSKRLCKSATTSGGVLAGRTIAGAVGNK